MGNEINPVRSGILNQTTGLAHGFYGRKGGVSDGLYTSLNCGFGSNDQIENVITNREIVAEHLTGQKAKINNPYQIHSDVCIIIDKELPENTPRADAIVTNKENLILGILTADCTPILFCDPKKRIIGAAHAGWKGAIGGIIQATIAKMTELGASPIDINCAIGPCIAQKSYEVGAEFKETFEAQSSANTQFFIPGIADGKYQFDLKVYCAHILASCGVQNIDVLANDTCAEEEEFFSNRRRNKRGEPDYGRNIAVIALQE